MCLPTGRDVLGYAWQFDRYVPFDLDLLEGEVPMHGDVHPRILSSALKFSTADGAADCC